MEIKLNRCINVSAIQVSPANCKCGWIIEGKSFRGGKRPQFEIVDVISDFKLIQLRELPADERVKSGFVLGRLNA